MNPARVVIESMYEDSCNVYEYVSVTNPDTNITKQREAITLENQKCRLSYKAADSAKEKEVASAHQTVKLFISPEVDIKPGSKIVVTHYGRALEFSKSGQPAIYDSHQEIVLESFRGYA